MTDETSWRSLFGRLASLAIVCLILVPGRAAPTADHWAFRAPQRPPEPALAQPSWARNAIDRFIAARLEKEGLTPSAEADRTTLIRRLSLDLLGLPPSLAEIDAFLADTSSDAYTRLVERLLSSPHYGERWGRHWLDAARYADTNGYEKDLPRSIWPYRDWVINAFNLNLPFDQFTIQQLAGDLLPGATLEQKVATGFLRNSMINEEGGVDPEQFRVEGLIDRVDTVGKAFLGLSINCAQCHDHKYDPISQREYYQFFAFLNNDDEPQLEVPTPEQRERRADILRKVAGFEDDLRQRHPEVPQLLVDWEKRMANLERPWTVLDPQAFYGAVGTKFTKLRDRSLLATASSPPVSGYTVAVQTSLTNITGFRLEVLRDPNLPAYGPGRDKKGNFVLTELTIDASPLADPSRTNRIALRNATADFSQPSFSVEGAIDGVLTNKTGWAVDAGPGRRNVDRKAVFQTAQPAGFAGGTLFTFHFEQVYGGEHTIGRFRISATTEPEPVADPLSTETRAALAKRAEDRNVAEGRLLFSAFRQTEERFAEENKKINALLDEWPIAPATLVLTEATEPRETRIFRRGDFRKPQDLVQSAVPAVLHPLQAGIKTNRLALAKWVVDRQNPLTARVIVNRIWQTYFGRGIVGTAEDFGTQGEPPTHPKLLDWLSVEFMESGWDVKALHRLIVQSATYRQTSRVTPMLLEKDPYNRLLARGPRQRVEAEIIRDIALAAGGLLSQKVGGPSVYPPIPEGVLSLGYGAPMPWPTSTGEDRYRRAMYTFLKRAVPYPSLVVFDAPNADSSCVRRIRSNTPLQALTTLNDAVFHEAAQAMGLRVYRAAQTDLNRAVYAFRLCVGRPPEAAELQTVLGLHDQQYAYFENRTAAALRVSSPDPANPPVDANLHQVAAWTLVSRVLLNLDETITKE